MSCVEILTKWVFVCWLSGFVCKIRIDCGIRPHQGREGGREEGGGKRGEERGGGEEGCNCRGMQLAEWQGIPDNTIHCTSNSSKFSFYTLFTNKTTYFSPQYSILNDEESMNCWRCGRRGPSQSLGKSCAACPSPETGVFMILVTGGGGMFTH